MIKLRPIIKEEFTAVCFEPVYEDGFIATSSVKKFIDELGVEGFSIHHFPEGKAPTKITVLLNESHVTVNAGEYVVLKDGKYYKTYDENSLSYFYNIIESD